MDWTFPWASSVDSDFNFDFNVSITEDQQREGRIEHNYSPSNQTFDATQVPTPVAWFAAMCGTDTRTYRRERPGMSAFVLEAGVVYHTYSTYARWLDALWGMYQWLDRAPEGRNENGTAPGGSATTSIRAKRNRALLCRCSRHTLARYGAIFGFLSG